MSRLAAETRIRKMEKQIQLRRRGSVVDAIAALNMLQFDYFIFPEHRPVGTIHGSISYDPREAWDNFWVDYVMVARCGEAMGRLTLSNFDPEVRAQLREEFKGFKAEDYFGHRK